jgi:hypothetical protein
MLNGHEMENMSRQWQTELNPDSVFPGAFTFASQVAG